MVSALAASALPSLVLARGHRIETVPELPLVLDDSIETIEKTSKAVEVLKKVCGPAFCPLRPTCRLMPALIHPSAPPRLCQSILLKCCIRPCVFHLTVV